MENYKSGSVLFDRITVLGKDFVTGSWEDDISAWSFAFDVAATPAEKKKKNVPLTYNYHWDGFFNIAVNSLRIRLHAKPEDPGLVEMEAKLQLVKTKMDFFTKELKLRKKTPAKKPHNEREWLNPPGTRFAGHLHMVIELEGSGCFTVADCDRSIHFWCEPWVDDQGNYVKDEGYKRAIQNLEDFAKGVGKGIKAIGELRKFFARELEAE